MKRLFSVLLFLFPAVGCTPENMYPSIAYVSQSLETASSEFKAGVETLADGHDILLAATRAVAAVVAPESLGEIDALQARLDAADKRFMEARITAAESRADDAENDANLTARINSGLKEIPGVGTILASIVTAIGGGGVVGRLFSKSGDKIDSLATVVNRMLPSPLAPGNGNGNGGTPA